MPLSILIVGAGVCGPALGYLLQSSNQGHNITIIERSPSIRTAGQQIDVKNQGVEVMQRMGLLGAIKSHRVDESGLEILNQNGEPIAQFGISPSGQQRLGLTSEYEIMRGDLVKLLYQASLEQDEKFGIKYGNGGRLTYEFGITITALDQDEGGVDVTLSDGQQRRYDVVVAADGQASRTRRLAFGPEASSTAFKSLGIHAAYFSIPKSPEEAKSAKMYSALDRRQILARNGDDRVTQILLFAMQDNSMLKRIYKEPIEKQKTAFTETFKGAGWQTDRFLTEMKTSENFYAHELGQIRMPRLNNGRVVLVGDAGYCPSPFTGMGAAGCLIGAYMLAGELTRQGENVAGALEKYNTLMRPVVDEVQRIPSLGLGLFFPSSQLGNWLLRNALWAASKFEKMMSQRSSRERHGWTLPDYSELNLEQGTEPASSETPKRI